MNKSLKIILIIVACIAVLAIVGGIIAVVLVNNTANAEEYKLGEDTIKSVKAIVGKRDVTSSSVETVNGVTTKKIEYKSSSVQEDLITYTQYLRNEGGFKLTKDMDLSETPSSIELGKDSKEAGKLMIMKIEYDSFGYTIIIQKGEGTLTVY